MIHQRWPLHPAPGEGEALSSWLSRVASLYKLSLGELLSYDFGYDMPACDFDLNPPVMLLENIKHRSNLSLDQIHHMTFRSWVPFIVDHLEADSNIFETYMLQYPVLPFKSHPSFALTNWRPWISSLPTLRACQTCIKSESEVIIRLAWKLPVMLSCPLHECRLQPCISFSSGYLYWEEEKLMDWPVTKAIITMDTRTWQALTAGKVDLPRRSIHAGVWFRFLRNLLNELTLPLSRTPKYSAIIKHIWETCGHPVRAGLNMWKPYEHLPLQKQMQILEAAATAMTMIEQGLLIFPGVSNLFQPELIDEDDLPSYPKPTNTKNGPRKLSFGEIIEQIIAEAKSSKECAQGLRAFCLWGKNDLESIKKIDAIFLELGIPFELS